MRLAGQAALLRIFLGERDHISHQPLYEVIVQRARAAGMAGATVLRAVEGFGASTIIHRAKLVELSTDLPFVVEIVDEEQKVREFLKTVDQLFEQSDSGGLITLEKVEIVKYVHSERKR